MWKEGMVLMEVLHLYNVCLHFHFVRCWASILLPELLFGIIFISLRIYSNKVFHYSPS